MSNYQYKIYESHKIECFFKQFLNSTLIDLNYSTNSISGKYHFKINELEQNHIYEIIINKYEKQFQIFFKDKRFYDDYCKGYDLFRLDIHSSNSYTLKLFDNLLTATYLVDSVQNY